MLMPADGEDTGEVAEVHDLEARRPKIGVFGLLLAAALVATTAVGMYGTRKMTARPVQSSLPVLAPPRAEPPPSRAPIGVTMEVAEIEGRRPRPPAVASSDPAPEPPAAPVPPKYVHHPRCDCLNDVAVCSCLGI